MWIGNIWFIVDLKERLRRVDYNTKEDLHLVDWYLKMTTWNFGEFQQDVDLSMDSLGVFNSLSLKRKGNCLVDLQLGRVDDSIDGLSNTWSVPQAAKKMSEPRLTRRARKTGTANTNASCLVEGCKSDLSNSREYHKRHKVCEIHAKTPIVMVEGQQQRFCQQCSRFHLLKEFDEVKRSCRKRLDGHNRRRRKVQPDVLSVSSAPIFHGHYQGGWISTLPQILTRPEASFSGHSLSPSFIEHQPLFPVTSGNHRIVSSWQPLPNMITSSHSNRALSLLSLTNPNLESNTMDDIVQAADTLSTLNSGLKHYNHSKFLLDSGSYNEFFCSENSWRTPGSFPILEKEYHLENTNLVSGGEFIERSEITSFLASAQTEPNSSPELLTLPTFWPG